MSSSELPVFVGCGDCPDPVRASQLTPGVQWVLSQMELASLALGPAMDGAATMVQADGQLPEELRETTSKVADSLVSDVAKLGTISVEFEGLKTEAATLPCSDCPGSDDGVCPKTSVLDSILERMTLVTREALGNTDPA